MNLCRISLLLIALVCAPFIAQATAAKAPHIKAVLKQQFPELVVDSVVPSPIAGLYQVNAGAMVLYVSKDARFAFSGDIIDLEGAHHNVTEEVRKQARLKGIKALAPETFIVFGPAKPKYTVTVFTDVDCGYCRKMQSEMKAINDLGVAIRYLPFPRSGPGTPGYEKMLNVWCSKDKKRALSLAKEDKPLVENATCSNSNVEKAFQFGLSMGVAGTPTLVFEDGTIVPGYLPPEKLREVAEQLAAKKS